MPNFAHTKEALLDMSPEHTPMIRGRHGIGKTEMIRQLCADPNGWNMRCCELQGSQLSDVGDLIGLMQIVDVVDSEGVTHKESAWVPPYWFPKDGKPFCLFLDEINRAAPPIKRAMMQIGNDHRLLNFSLPEGSRVVCACNPSDDGDYDVEEFDKAENDRFWHTEFTPDAEEAFEYWRKIGVITPIIEYCQRNVSDLDGNLKASAKVSGARSASGKANPAEPSRRSWVKLNNDIKRALARNEDAFSGREGIARLEMLASGWVGPAVAANFAEFYKQCGNGLAPEKVLLAEKWTSVKKDIKKLSASTVDTIRFGESMVNWIIENEDKMHAGRKVTDFGKKIAANMNNFMREILPEEAVQIATTQFDKYRKSTSTNWVGIVSAASPELTDFLTELADMDI